MRVQATSVIIEFPLERTRPPGGAPLADGGEVLIFTGVRIERMYDLAERLPPAWTANGGDVEIWLR